MCAHSLTQKHTYLQIACEIFCTHTNPHWNSYACTTSTNENTLMNVFSNVRMSLYCCKCVQHIVASMCLRLPFKRAWDKYYHFNEAFFSVLIKYQQQQQPQFRPTHRAVDYYIHEETLNEMKKTKRTKKWKKRALLLL